MKTEAMYFSLDVGHTSCLTVVIKKKGESKYITEVSPSGLTLMWFPRLLAQVQCQRWFLLDETNNDHH